MLEKIYTIPINEQFDMCAANKAEGCPICRLYNYLENNELELILGAAMMEPDTRIKTNEKGFCSEHYKMMLQRKNRLGMALILESHLNETKQSFDEKMFDKLFRGVGSGPVDKIKALNESCYLCEKIDEVFEKMLENIVYLWDSEPDFVEKLRGQHLFCLPHFEMLTGIAKKVLPKKRFLECYKDLSAVTVTYFDELCKDVSWFCKKFDYRYENEPWGNSKDAIERSIAFLKGDMHRDIGKRESK